MFVHRSVSLFTRRSRLKLNPHVRPSAANARLWNGIATSACQPCSVTRARPSQIVSKAFKKRVPLFETNASPSEPAAPIWNQ